MRAATCFALLPAASTLMALLQHVPRATGYTYNVMSDVESSSSDDDSASSSSYSSSAGLNSINNDAIYSLPDALSKAEPGDTIVLANGTYTDRLESYGGGEEGNPITIVGERGAVLQSNSPSVHIEHSWITLEGFTVDGFHGSVFEADSFVNKCVEVIGTGENETQAVEGFVMKNMVIQNCGGECVRLKNFVINANITGNIIEHCGMYDFEFAGNATTDGKNGEGIYIGTSSNQWTYGEDRCNGNLVSGNRIATYGNECVEMKEGSSNNVIENNVCSNQRDVNSGCLCSRGDSNTFRFNNVSDCEGAGVRLGGWEKEGHQYGQNNSVYGNNIYHVDNGAVNAIISPQQVICENTCEDGVCERTGDDDETWDTACPSEAYEQDGGGDDEVAEDEETEDEEEKGEDEREEEEVSTPSPVEATPSPAASMPSPTADEEEEEEETSSESTEKDDVDDDDDDDDVDADDDGVTDGDDSIGGDDDGEESGGSDGGDDTTDDDNSVDDDATDDTGDDGEDGDDDDDASVDDDDDTKDNDDDDDDDDSNNSDTASSGDESRRRRLRGASN